MWESSTMSFTESLIASCLGLIIVMTALIILALAIKVITKSMKVLGLGADKNTPTTPTLETVDNENELDEESYAVIMAAACEEMKISPDQFQITEIHEIN